MPGISLNTNTLILTHFKFLSSLKSFSMKDDMDDLSFSFLQNGKTSPNCRSESHQPFILVISSLRFPHIYSILEWSLGIRIWFHGWLYIFISFYNLVKSPPDKWELKFNHWIETLAESNFQLGVRYLNFDLAIPWPHYNLVEHLRDTVHFLEARDLTLNPEFC